MIKKFNKIKQWILSKVDYSQDLIVLPPYLFPDGEGNRATTLLSDIEVVTDGKVFGWRFKGGGVPLEINRFSTLEKTIKKAQEYSNYRRLKKAENWIVIPKDQYIKQ